MLSKLWNLIFLTVITCGLSKAGEVEINVGQLRGVYATHARDIDVFLTAAPGICKCVIDRDSYQSKKMMQELLSSVNQLLYARDLNFRENCSVNMRGNGKVDLYNEASSAITQKSSAQLLFLSLEEGDLAEEELWNLAKFQLIHTFINGWYHSSVRHYFSNNKKLNVAEYNTRSSHDVCVLLSLLVKGLFEAEKADCVTGEMMPRIEDSKEKWNSLLAAPKEDYAMF